MMTCLVLERTLKFDAHFLAFGRDAIAHIDEQYEYADQGRAAGPQEDQPGAVACARASASSPSHFTPPVFLTVAGMTD
jgi:hypothetical protein